MTSRWERLLETKPIPLVDHLLDEVAKLVASDLHKWPLPIEELDVATGRQFAELCLPGTSPPAPDAVVEAFRLASWELRRELEPVDDYFRNRRWLERGLPTESKTMLLFLSRWLVEQMLGLGEATEGRLRRSELVDCLDRVERRWAKTSGAA